MSGKYRSARPALTPDSLEEFRDAEPRFVRCENGGWLALSPDDAVVGVGVFGWAVEQARYKWNRARADWINSLREILNERSQEPAAPREPTNG